MKTWKEFNEDTNNNLGGSRTKAEPAPAQTPKSAPEKNITPDGPAKGIVTKAPSVTNTARNYNTDNDPEKKVANTDKKEQNKPEENKEQTNSEENKEQNPPTEAVTLYKKHNDELLKLAKKVQIHIKKKYESAIINKYLKQEVKKLSAPA